MKFYFVYKSLAHPELAGNYVQPFTLDERLAHARQAEKQLGATVPWLVDDMENRLKHALGDRANSEFIVNPKGIIVRKRAWSHPGEVRKDLEQLVGPVENITKEEDLQLNVGLPLEPPAPRGTLPRVDRSQMQAIAIQPQIDLRGLPYYAKLRAEADEDLLATGAGKLYVGFHLDPFHDAHWNNLTKPLSFKLDAPGGIEIEKVDYEAPKGKAASDTDPREFLLDVHAWPEDRPIRLTVTYFACIGKQTCHAVQQQYVLNRRRDRDAGKARGEGAGYWDSEEFAGQMRANDKDGDGRLDKSEVRGLILPHFDDFDANKDDSLDAEELKAVADWLNHHHQPGAAPPDLQRPTK